MESARTDLLCRSSAMGIGRSNFMSVASRGREAFCVVFWGVRRSRWLDGCVSSDKGTLTEEERAVNLLAPANIPSSEKIYYRKPQLRREDLSPEESSSSYKACFRRSWCLQACVCSDKDLLTVEARAA